MQASGVSLRRLENGDIDAVVGIEKEITAQSRRGFYEKRFAAMSRRPQSFVALGAEVDGALAGFLVAHIQHGEFGGEAPVAVLDTLGVNPRLRRRGTARALMDGLDAVLREKGVGELRTQAEWSEHDLVAFFAAGGFELAPGHHLGLDIDFNDPAGDRDREPARDRITVRSLQEGDQPGIVAIDRKITGRDRSDYYADKVAEVVTESGVRVSQVAEEDGHPVGFVMARVDFGEFGRTDPTAVVDTIGVHPDYGGRSVGTALLSQLLVNLASLRVERVHTQVEWDNVGLVSFLARAGFRPTQRLSFVRRIG